MKRRLRKSSCLAGLCFLALFLWLALYKVSDGHVVDYAIWRWMVTFKQPVQRVDDYRVVVIKSEHRLKVYDHGEPIAEYPIALSRYGLAPRKVWADSLTPEGEFLIASMQYKSVFGPRQMLLDTTAPSLRDYIAQYGQEGAARIAAWEAEHGKLDTIWEVYDFNEANQEQRIWNDILIHGGGAHSDWTLGCIALNDEDMLELFDLLHRSEKRGLGIVVEISP
ncbi:MAG TPA: L,D-transpeptidase [Anaerolineae bacterium]|nr:L,D-transpeptidase [Anaerolineae bacterium]HQH38100.1 L,D-transpeptidase [Anaerolineae bacterium]